MNENKEREKTNVNKSDRSDTDQMRQLLRLFLERTMERKFQMFPIMSTDLRAIVWKSKQIIVTRINQQQQQRQQQQTTKAYCQL